MSDYKAEGAQWARGVLDDPRTAVLDTETTGLKGYICEISVYDGEKFLIDTLVNPQAFMEPGAQRVHGITAEELAAAPVFAEIWPDLAKLIESRRIIGWNAPFDAGVVMRELGRLDVDLTWELRWECAMRQYSTWYHEDEYGSFIRLNGGHRAGQDCAAVFERLKEMAG